MLQETLLTAEGLKELEEELEQLKTVGRKEAAEKIKSAKTIVISEKDQKSDTAENDEKTVGNDSETPPETK